jgi:hypothetical protein
LSHNPNERELPCFVSRPAGQIIIGRFIAKFSKQRLNRGTLGSIADFCSLIDRFFYEQKSRRQK